ncbi:NAD-dependent epimerase/dehydratase family protein [Altererythrobacter aquiaggeris]|uniref:NAD-dependent epimerase/dehydratase family protein n=1 Tax=Aestuarierythrobacter aquiaggeris TaxID=1898396 RepID=UPI003019971B
MTIAITGGTGFVGQSLIDLAKDRGFALRSLARKVPVGSDGVDWIAGDLRDKTALQRLAKGAQAVIHIAGQVRAVDPAEFEESNVKGTLNVVEAALEAGVSRFVFVSSLAAREPHLSAYGASKKRAEKLVMASGLDWSIVRPPAVYGPRDSEMLDMFKAAKFGVVPMPPEGRASLIHVDDLAALLAALVDPNEDATRMIFEPDDGRENGWSHRELAKAIGWAVGRRPFVPHLPRRVLKFAARLDGLIRQSGAKLTADRVGYLMHPDWTVSKLNAVPSGIWRPAIATRAGLKSTAQWYRKAGWL